MRQKSTKCILQHRSKCHAQWICSKSNSFSIFVSIFLILILYNVLRKWWSINFPFDKFLSSYMINSRYWSNQIKRGKFGTIWYFIFPINEYSWGNINFLFLFSSCLCQNQFSNFVLQSLCSYYFSLIMLI